MPTIVPAFSPESLAAVRRLFEEYAASLTIDLKLQHIDRELISLPGNYAPPGGALFLAIMDGAPAGCIGLRPFSATVGELKRLYIPPAFRGKGLARDLVRAAIAAARSAGYEALVLDTLPSMHGAIALYESFGFQRTAPYWASPFPDVLYFRLDLAAETSPN